MTRSWPTFPCVMPCRDVPGILRPCVFIISDYSIILITVGALTRNAILNLDTLRLR